MPGLAEWQFSDSAEIQLCEEKQHAGHAALTIGTLPLESERKRLLKAGSTPEAIEESKRYLIIRIRDPDGNLIVFASAQRE